MNNKPVLNSELPFAHFFFDEVKTEPKDPYESMKTLIESYGLGFDAFKCMMINNQAIMAGSAVLRVLLNNVVDYTPGDLDIWLRWDNGRKSNDHFMKYLLTYGYKIDMSSVFPFNLISSDGDEDETSEMIDHPYASRKIERVLTFLKGDKKIQLVFTRVNAYSFIKSTFDISSTASFWYPYRNEAEEESDLRIIPNDKGHLYRKEMYICNHYVDYFKLPDDDKRKRKLMERIKKYESRGFTLVKEHMECLEGFDPRTNFRFLKGEVFDMVAAENVKISIWLRESSNIILYLTKDSIHAVNRFELYEYIIKNRKTYWGHAVSSHAAKYLLYGDFSVYTLEKLYEKADGYSFGCNTVLRSIYKHKMFEFDYELMERLDNFNLNKMMNDTDKRIERIKKNMERKKADGGGVGATFFLSSMIEMVHDGMSDDEDNLDHQTVGTLPVVAGHPFESVEAEGWAAHDYQDHSESESE